MSTPYKRDRQNDLLRAILRTYGFIQGYIKITHNVFTFLTFSSFCLHYYVVTCLSVISTLSYLTATHYPHLDETPHFNS